MPVQLLQSYQLFIKDARKDKKARFHVLMSWTLDDSSAQFSRDFFALIFFYDITVGLEIHWFRMADDLSSFIESQKRKLEQERAEMYRAQQQFEVR